MTLSAEQAFERDVPKEMHDDVLTAITEAAQEGKGTYGWVSIIDQDRMDAINVRAEGSITIDGREYAFIVESGNWNGTVLESWEEAGTQTFEHRQPTQWTLAPRSDLVSDAICSGRGPFLILKWDAMLARPEIARIPGNYAYDRMMQPGGKIEGHYKDAAAKHGFILTDKEHADEIRARLTKATTPIAIAEAQS
ncbi:hypothetical protein RBI22_15335 [Alcaligenaceae bacterium C4P045]|nr:hypothetical protein [Alcaligenaceae bacterium C4P045]